MAALIAVAAIDLEHRIVPNRILLPPAAYGVAASAALDRTTCPSSSSQAPGHSRFCCWRRSPTRAGMGMGDVKLAGAMGLYLGLSVAPALLVAFLSGSSSASRWSPAWAPRRARRRVPFGPFLALGGLVGLLAGPELIDLYETPSSPSSDSSVRGSDIRADTLRLPITVRPSWPSPSARTHHAASSVSISTAASSPPFRSTAGRAVRGASSSSRRARAPTARSPTATASRRAEGLLQGARSSRATSGWESRTRRSWSARSSFPRSRTSSAMPQFASRRPRPSRCRSTTPCSTTR